MAGLKKSKQKDPSSPNMVLLIALILFVLVSIGLGVFAYYGYEGQEALRQKANAAKIEVETIKKNRDGYLMLGYEGMLALGFEPNNEQKQVFNLVKSEFVTQPDKFVEVKPVLDIMFQENAAKLKGFNQAETRYESNYKTEITKALESAKKSQAMLDTVKNEYDDFKKRYNALDDKYKKDIEEVKDQLKKDAATTLAAAQKTNSKFPEIQNLLKQREIDIKANSEKFEEDLNQANGRIARLNEKVGDLEKKLNDRSLGLTLGAAGGGSGGDVHALMLDISRGLPLWDRPVGKIIRVDASNLLVSIDLGSKSGLVPDVTFNVFANGPGGKADKQLKGTIEVVRITGEATALARITSLYDAQGASIPLQSESLRVQAVRSADNILREGDLIFNPFFGTHVFIAGNVNFSGDRIDSPSSQSLHLQEFIQQLRKQHMVVDGYINPLNGQIEGNLTPKTRLLIRGEIAALNSREEERARFKQMAETFQVVKKQAVEHGMLIISAENLAVMVGYRPFQPADRGAVGQFRPSIPWTGGSAVLHRVDPGQEGRVIAPPAPMPEMEKKDKDDK